MVKPDIKDLTDVISNFVNSLDNRSDIFLAFSDSVITKMLEWQLTAWKNWLSPDHSFGEETDWFIIYEMINQGFLKIGRRNIKIRDAFSVSFLKNYKQFIEKHQADAVKTEKGTWNYVSYSYKLFFDLLIEFIDSLQYNGQEFLWQQFPNDWKVTLSNLRNRKVLAELTLHHFIDWAVQRVGGQKQEYDKTMHLMVNGLFPELDSQTWEIILLFVFSPYDAEARVKSVIDRHWSIGLISVETLTFSYTIKEGQNEKEIIAQKHKEIEETIKMGAEKAYELALALFGSIFKKELLVMYEKEALSLDYPKDSIEDDKKQDLLRVLSGLKQHLNKS